MFPSTVSEFFWIPRSYAKHSVDWGKASCSHVPSDLGRDDGQ